MVWILLAGILIPAVLVALVVTRDRYFPWLHRRRATISFIVGVLELLVAVATLVRGISSSEDWVRIVSGAVLGISFIWLSRREVPTDEEPNA